MKHYEVVKVNSERYIAFVLSKSYVNPISYRKEISCELSGMIGYVLFDLLLVNGLASNRFIEAFYDGSSFVFDTFHSVQDISNQLMDISFNYYYANKETLNNSVLSNIERLYITLNL